MNMRAVVWVPMRSWHHLPIFVLFCLLMLYAGVLVRTAWLTDDSYITFRSIDHWVSGYGLRWNIAERVQAYTHPLWMLLITLIYFFTHEFYYSVLIFSIFLSLLTVSLVAFLSVSARNAMLGVLFFIFSKAFVDYSSSGLENPLTHLLVVLFFIVHWRLGKLRWFWPALAFLAGLIALNRLDTIVLVLPALLYSGWREWRERGWGKTLGFLLGGFGPFLLWEVFSLVYYGFPFPNTAYAKLFGAQVPGVVLFKQGFYYLLDSVYTDPLTLLVIVVAAAASVFKREWRMLVAMFGMVGYLFYTVKIGGDFMSGRYLSAPFLIAVIILTQIRFSVPQILLVSSVAFIVGLFVTPHPPLLTTADYTYVAIGHDYKSNWGIADERSYYYFRTGLLRSDRSAPQRGWVDRVTSGRSGWVWPGESGGMTAFSAGPEAYIINQFALADPLLARLPVSGVWRIGHGERALPAGYVETLETDQNKLCDPALRRYYEALRDVTRNSLFTAQRFKTVWQLNTGQLDYLRQHYNPLATCR